MYYKAIENVDENEDLSDTNNRSELAQEIISEKSGFLEKWTLLIFLGVFLLLLFMSWFIKYPDIIEASATLTAASAPKEISIRQDGRLVRLFVHNNDTVKQNEVLGWIESTASHQDVLQLSAQIDSSISLLYNGHSERVTELFLKNYTNLGEIQQGYQNFIIALQNYNDYVVNGFYENKRSMLMNDIQALKNTNQTIQNQKIIAENDLKLAEETYKMNKKLYEEKVLAQDELRQQNSKYLIKQLALPQLNASLLSNGMQQREKDKEMQQLEHDRQVQPEIFQQALQTLKSEVDDWKKKFILQSPINGVVSFINPLQENQFLQLGRLIGFIIPNDNHYYAEAYLSQINFGKIDTGRRVQLRFEAYPYLEVGVVEGTVDYVSNLASDSGFLITIRLNNGLITTGNKSIPYKNGLKAQTIIITKNMRLLKRLWYDVKKSASVGKKS